MTQMFGTNTGQKSMKSKKKAKKKSSSMSMKKGMGKKY